MSKIRGRRIGFLLGLAVYCFGQRSELRAESKKETGAAAVGAAEAEWSDAEETLSERDEVMAGDDMPAAAPDPAWADYWAALKWFRAGAEADLKDGRKALERAAAAELPHAQLLLGQCYESGGYGYRRSARKAAALYRLAAERGSGFAQLTYGICLFAGIGESRNVAAAETWLRRAVSDGADYTEPEPPADFDGSKTNPDVQPAAADDGIVGATTVDRVSVTKAVAHYYLAQALAEQDKKSEAHLHFVTAAMAGGDGRSGVQQAAIQAALDYAFGQGVDLDPDKANEMLDLSKKLNRRSGAMMVHTLVTNKLVDEFATMEMEETIAKETENQTLKLQYEIAQRFSDSKSETYNPREAVKWFQLAAESGKAWAMLELGFLYSGSALGAPDLAEAFKWWERAGGGKVARHTLGVANLVICLQNGIGVERDEVRARKLAEQYSDIDIVSYLQTKGLCPAAIVTFDERTELIRRTAKKKDPHAQYLWGRAFHFGSGVDFDLNEAIIWYRRAIKGGDAAAMYALAVLYDYSPGLFDYTAAKGDEKARELYLSAAAQGHLKAQNELGVVYLFGKGVEADPDLAIEYFERACALDVDSGVAWNNLGTAFLQKAERDAKNGDAEGARASRAKALEDYRRADQLGYEYAAGNIGQMYYEGFNGERDLMQAYAYLERGAEAGHGGARMLLARMFDRGEGVPVSYTEAAYYYRLAALAGNRTALKRLIAYYIEGKGGTQDFTRAKFWLSRLLQYGDWTALPTWVDLTMSQGNYGDAVAMLKSLRATDDLFLKAFAYERLSTCYLNGYGVKPNPRRSRAYLQTALKLGNVDAMVRSAKDLISAGRVQEGIALYEKAAPESAVACFALGQMYYSGQDVSLDRAKALDYLKRAAAGHHRDALYFLAVMTMNRAKDASDLSAALEYIKAAEVLGHPEAAVVRRKLEQMKGETTDTGETSGPRSI